MESKRNTAVSDQEYIEALKSGNSRLTQKFFMDELRSVLCHVQYDLFRGRVEYNELVNELYLFLSENNWSKLDTFQGKNGSRLRTWMSPVAWRFFTRSLEKLQENESNEDSLPEGDSACALDKSIEIAIDINAVMQKMPNKRYVEAIDLLIMQGYEAEEVARRWETNLANVYNIKHRAVKQFIEFYGK